MRTILRTAMLAALILLGTAECDATKQQSCGRYQVVVAAAAPSGEPPVILRIDTQTGRTWFWVYASNGWVNASEGGEKP